MNAKEYLMQVKKTHDRINEQVEHIQRLRDALDVGAMDYSKDKIQVSPDPDKFGKAFAEITELENELKQMKHEFVRTKKNMFIGIGIWLFAIFTIAIIILQRVEVKKLMSILGPLDEIERVKYAEENKKKSSTYNAFATLCLILFNYYVINGDYEKAKENMFFRINKSPFSCYSLYIYYLHNKEYDKLEKLFEKLVNAKDLRLKPQQESIKLIKNLAYNGIYSEKLETSRYEYVKKMCEDYKSGKFITIETSTSK